MESEYLESVHMTTDVENKMQEANAIRSSTAEEQAKRIIIIKIIQQH